MSKKILCLCLFLVSLFCFFGCEESNSTKLYKNVTQSTKTVENVLNDIYIPVKKDLIIDSFIDEDIQTYLTHLMNRENKEQWHNVFSFNLENNYQPKYTNQNSNSNKFDNFVNTLQNVNLQMEDSLCAVCELENNKEKLLLKIKEINNKIKEIKNEKIENSTVLLANELIKEIEYLCKNFNNDNNNLKT